MPLYAENIFIMADIQILPDAIIQRIESAFKKRKGNIPCSDIELGYDLANFVKDEKVLIGDGLTEYFKTEKKLSPRTIGRALNRGKEFSKWGANAQLRNLLCFYAYNLSWEKTQVQICIGNILL